MRTRFHAPRGVGPGGEGFNVNVDLPLVPRKGETVELDGKGSFRVHEVVWYPEEAEPLVYIILH